ncbi:hypothetical protein C2845_PM05G26250 [Panicum miliaceum]|uniref:Uncharacterized protein n=1 Tax=Panicum miliaceum TaxID=4540 RepID=A0A3L6T2J8_PANMI|nr:hypothetical protein C2845_PM05G26250 [Panicum miliaceum]
MGIPQTLNLFLFAGVAWAIWKIRNKMAIEKSFVNAPSEVIFLGLSFLQKWRPLLKEDKRSKIDESVRMISDWLCNFSPAGALLSSDVGEI